LQNKRNPIDSYFFCIWEKQEKKEGKKGRGREEGRKGNIYLSLQNSLE